MRRGTTAAPVAAMAAAAALVLAGCTPGSGPSPTAPVSSAPPVTATPPSTPTPTESVAPETVAPERPAEMDDISVEGAEATARYFLELYPYVYATGDLEEWESLSHPECKFCASVAEDVVQAASSGHTSRGGMFSIELARAVKVSDDLYSVDFEVVQGASETFDVEGKRVGESGESTGLVNVLLIPEASAWAVRGVELEQRT